MPEPVSTVTAIISIGSALRSLFGGSSKKKKRRRRAAAAASAAQAAETERLRRELDELRSRPVTPQLGFAPPPLPPQVAEIIKLPKILQASGRLLGVGGLIVIGAEILRQSIEARQLAGMESILRRQAEDLDRRQKEAAREKKRREAAARAPAPEIIFPNFPEIFREILRPRRAPQPSPQRRTRDRPTPPIVAPEIPQQPVVLPRKVPVKVPKETPLPGTTPTRTPSPVPTPVPRPVPVPRTTIPIPRRLRILFPVFGFPLPSPRPRLTRPDATRVPLPKLRPGSQIDPQFAVPQPQPGAPPKTDTKRCEEVKRRRRRKGKCREGFFREFPGRTQFTTWRERPCL